MSGTIRSSDEVIKPILNEDGELDLENIPKAIEALMTELQKPAVNAPRTQQYVQLLSQWTQSALSMLATQVAGVMAEVGHLANALTSAVDPEAPTDPNVSDMAQESLNLMLASMELDRLRRIVDMMYELNRPKLEVPGS